MYYILPVVGADYTVKIYKEVDLNEEKAKI